MKVSYLVGALALISVVTWADRGQFRIEHNVKNPDAVFASDVKTQYLDGSIVQDENGSVQTIQVNDPAGAYRIQVGQDEQGRAVSVLIGTCKCSVAGGTVNGAKCSQTNCEDGTTCKTAGGGGGNSCGFYTAAMTSINSAADQAESINP